jgi:hypothetical protein
MFSLYMIRRVAEVIFLHCFLSGIARCAVAKPADAQRRLFATAYFQPGAPWFRT